MLTLQKKKKLKAIVYWLFQTFEKLPEMWMRKLKKENSSEMKTE